MMVNPFSVSLQMRFMTHRWWRRDGRFSWIGTYLGILRGSIKVRLIFAGRLLLPSLYRSVGWYGVSLLRHKCGFGGLCRNPHVSKFEFTTYLGQLDARETPLVHTTHLGLVRGRGILYIST